MTPYPKIPNVFNRDPDNRKYLIWQYSSSVFEYLEDNYWESTEKIDGTNIRILWDGGSFEIKGRTDKSQMYKPLLMALQDMCSDRIKLFDDAFDVGPDSVVCLYGEGVGPHVNKSGKYTQGGYDFILFDIRIGRWWLKRANVYEIAKALELRHVPVICTGTLEHSVMLALDGVPSRLGDFTAEGLVLRPTEELFLRNGERVITKAKTNDFLQEKDF